MFILPMHYKDTWRTGWRGFVYASNGGGGAGWRHSTWGLVWQQATTRGAKLWKRVEELPSTRDVLFRFYCFTFLDFLRLGTGIAWVF